MKKSAIIVMSIVCSVLFFTRCHVEEIQSNEISDPNPIDTSAIVYTYTPPPCALDSNKYRFAGTNYTLSTPVVTSNSICSNSDYQIYGDVNSGGGLTMYFASKPHTGIYTVSSTPYSLDPDLVDQVYFHIDASGGQNYQPEAGTLVYVNNNGVSVKASFCATPVSSGSTVFQNNYGQIVVY